jgi:diguanylate cyclase
MHRPPDPLLESALGDDAAAPAVFAEDWRGELAEAFFALPELAAAGLVDAQGRLWRASPKTLAAFGVAESELGSRPLSSFFEFEDAFAVEQAEAEARASGQSREVFARLDASLHPKISLGSDSAHDEGEHWLRLRFAPRPGLSASHPLAFFAEPVATPLLGAPAVADPADAQASLSSPASLGTAPWLSREAFFPLLERAAREKRAENTPTDILALINLDGFRKVNDALGHKNGDAFLAAVAENIRSALRRGDPVAKVGPDEFAILLRHCPASLAGTIVQRSLSAVERRVRLGSRVARCSASAGLCEVTGAQSADDCWRQADDALRQAKAFGGNHWRLAEAAAAAPARALDADLRLHEAIDNGEFHLHYQPIFDPATRRARGAEALMRWQSPQGPIPPSDFIPRAEETGLIHHLGEWAVRAACMQMALWESHGLSMGYVSVNASARQLHSPRFAQAVWQALADSGIDGSRLVIEITESALALDADRAASVLRQLSQLGVRFSIDDFGTGHACLANLKSFPVSMLKIDRGFVRGLPDDRADRAIVSSALSLARDLGLDVVAEGVETDEQLGALEGLGCASIQGYLLARPMPADELFSRFRRGELTPAPLPAATGHKPPASFPRRAP